MIRPPRAVGDHENRSDKDGQADPGHPFAPDVASLPVRLIRHPTQKKTSGRSVCQSAFRQTRLGGFAETEPEAGVHSQRCPTGSSAFSSSEASSSPRFASAAWSGLCSTPTL
jgi:hypothetical protein